MRVERELAGFAIPFAAASAAVIFLGVSPYSTGFITIALLSCAVMISILMYPAHGRMSDNAIRACLILLAAATGAISGFTGLHESPQPASNVISRTALSAGVWCRHLISEIEFSHCESNALINALLTGDRSLLSDETVAAFRNSGASHILALSGLHLGMIYSILLVILKPLGNSIRSRRIRSGITIASCGFYTLAVGAGPSILRAFLFITLTETARTFLRHRSTGNTLMASLIIHITLNPSDISSAGFQLSYAAMAGIAYIYPWFKNFWPEGTEFPLMRRIWNSLAMSISCQITTAPFAYLHFRSIPLNFMLTNLIAIPMIGLIIPCSLLTLVLSTCGMCPDLLINITEALVTVLTRALMIISEM